MHATWSASASARPALPVRSRMPGFNATLADLSMLPSLRTVRVLLLRAQTEHVQTSGSERIFFGARTKKVHSDPEVQILKFRP